MAVVAAKAAKQQDDKVIWRAVTVGRNVWSSLVRHSSFRAQNFHRRSWYKIPRSLDTRTEAQTHVVRAEEEIKKQRNKNRKLKLNVLSWTWWRRTTKRKLCYNCWPDHCRRRRRRRRRLRNRSQFILGVSCNTHFNFRRRTTKEKKTIEFQCD